MGWFRGVRGCRSAGLGLIFTALGCGGQAEDGARPAQPSFSAPRAMPTLPPAASAPQRPRPAPMTQPAPVMRPTPPPVPSRPPGGYSGDKGGNTARAAAENVLAANCGACHGSALTRAQALAGINFIEDADQLVDAGLIIPLSSATSRIVVVMRDGSMPPAASGLPEITEADIDTVVNFIDNPRYWPEFIPPAAVDAGLEAPRVDAGADGD